MAEEAVMVVDGFMIQKTKYNIIYEIVRVKKLSRYEAKTKCGEGIL